MSNLDSVAPPLYKLVLARALDIQAWVDPATDELARRAEPLSIDEASALPMEDVLRISALREEVLRTQATQQTITPARARTRDNMYAILQRRTETSASSSLTAASPVEPPLPQATVQFSRKELGQLSAAFTKGYKFDDVLALVTPEKIPAFCHALADFSDLLSPDSAHGTSFSHSLFKRVANKPSFIPIAVQLATFIVIHNEYAGAMYSFSDSLFGFRRCLQNDVNGLRSLWESLSQAKTKYPKFSLAYKSGARGHHFTVGLLGFDRGNKAPRERDYEQRSANVRQFISALSADELRLVM